MKRIIIRDTDAQNLKEKGNQSFMEKDYQSAIIYYTSALKKSSNESALYSNRSRCYYMLKDYSNSIKDAKIAIELDLYNIKAYLLYCRGLGNISKQGMNYYEAEIALRCCNSALQICKSASKPEFISTCKSLKRKLRALVFLKKRENYNYKISRLKSYYKGILKQKRVIELFDKYLIEKKTPPIPDYLYCPITLETFTQPVITECGHTYDCNELLTHFSKIGTTDPITRRYINPHAVIRNPILLVAKSFFIKKEPWSKISDKVINSLYIEF